MTIPLPLYALCLLFPAAVQTAAPELPPKELAWLVCTGSADEPGGMLAQFDVANGRVQRIVPLSAESEQAQQPLEIALLPGGAGALVARLDPRGASGQATLVQTVSLADGRISSTASFAGWLDGLEFHPQTGALWATHLDVEGRRALVRVDLERGALEVVGALPDDLAPRSLAFSGDGRSLWCLSATNVAKTDALVELDPQTAKILRRIPWDASEPAHALDIDAAGRLLAFAWGGTLHEFDARSGRSRQRFALADTRLAVPVGFDIPRVTKE